MKAMLEREVAYPPEAPVAPRACVHLGRTYYVYEFDSRVVVRRPRLRRSHETVERCYDAKEVRALARYYAAQTVTAEQALADVRSGHVQLPTVSWRPHACTDVRDMLIALCALGHARLRSAPAGPPAFAFV